MFRQIIFGMPMHCINRICKAPFHKQSLLGYRAKSEVEIIAVMECPRCKDRIYVNQLVSMVSEYVNKLPIDPVKVVRPNNLITRTEIERISKRLANDKINPLASLYSGPRPPGSYPIKEE